ncbi:NAD-binding protein [Allofustis seminis]|uniref:NAD-binding protein n=1 Tax=Allofustis seminis TaxID=166939 RepID=UPI00036CAD27|nr:NAD-binding protein [Allofustis seminis]
MRKNVLIMGGFKNTSELVHLLLETNYQVTIINHSRDVCARLALIDGIRVIQGDGTRPYILDEALASEADIAIALTNNDENNLVFCQLAKEKFGVKRTICLLEDSLKKQFFYDMGIDGVVSAMSMLSEVIKQEAVLSAMAHVIPVGEGRVQIAEVPITRESPVIGQCLIDINLPKDVIIGTILREDYTIIPSGETTIHRGDVLVLLATHHQEVKAIEVLTGKASETL